MLRLGAGNPNIQDMVKGLFDILSMVNPEESLSAITKEELSAPQWRKDLIHYDYLIGKSKNGYFWPTEDGHRILSNSIQFSMWDHEIYSFILYYEYLQKMKDTYETPGFRLTYGNSNSWSEIPFVKFTNDYINLKVKSYVNKDDGEFLSHYLWIDSYGDIEIEKFLTENGFSRKTEEDTVFRRREKNWNKGSNIEDYRAEVGTEVLKFAEKLSKFIKMSENEQQ